jgi:hypothetical protein
MQVQASSYFLRFSGRRVSKNVSKGVGTVLGRVVGIFGTETTLKTTDSDPRLYLGLGLKTSAAGLISYSKLAFYR